MMMDQEADAFDLASSRLLADFKNLISDSEELLYAEPTATGEGFARARAKFQAILNRAKAALAIASQPVFDRTRQTAATANNYVNGNPWTAVGIAMSAGLLIGFLAARR
ncbi:MAG: DUF883 domain-containing protein [Betaproteobacteria bacterium]